MKKRKFKKRILVAGIIIAIAGTGGFFTYKWAYSKQKVNIPAKQAQESPFIAFARGKIDVEGSIVKLSASKDGVVRELLVEEGQKVKKGQILCKLDDIKEKLNLMYCKAEAELALKRIEPLKVSLEAARREWLRSDSLIKKNVISRQQWDENKDTVNRLEAEIKVAEAEAQVSISKQKQAEYDMELKIIRSPDNGKILRCDVMPGYGISTLNVTVLFLFVPDLPFVVRAEIEEKFIRSIKPGTQADIILDTEENKVYTGKVLKIGNYLGPKRLSFDEAQEKNDVRTTECILSIDEKDLILGQRVLVKFKRK